MTLSQRPLLRQALAQECIVCGRNRDEEQAAEDMTEAALFGLKDPYAVCPSCHQQVVSPTLLEDVEYRRKVRVFYFTHYNRVLTEE